METFNKTAMPFRVALGLGQGIDIGLSKGIIYQIGEEQATTMKELQQMYIGAGSTEMYVRIATKRYNDDDTYHARIHNLETSLEYCRVAAALDHPINPEIMCAHTYMDASTPRISGIILKSQNRTRNGVNILWRRCAVCWNSTGSWLPGRFWRRDAEWNIGI